MPNHPLNLDKAGEWAGVWWLPDAPIVHGKRDITAGTAIRLARYFGTSEESSSHYELRRERRALVEQVEAIAPLRIV